MATLQLSHPATKQMASKWSVLFPTKIATEHQSLVLIKRLLAVSVSCITYLRGLFPESAYGTHYLDELCFRILREDKCCAGSTQIVKWMQGCFDALEKKYLRMIILAFYTNPEDPETVTELYQFKFKYGDDGPAMDFVSSHIDIKTRVSNEEIKKTSVLLLRKLYILMQNLGPLPNDVTLTMKLFYYNDVTPDDYHPSGFKKDKSMSSLTFEGDPVHLKVGALTTGFHSMKVKVTTESDRVTAMGEELVQEKSTEISHRGLDCDEEEEEECVNLCTLVSRNDPERKTEVAERTEYDADAFWTNEEERNTVNPTKVNSANLIETKKTKSIIHREEENQQPEEGPTLLEALKTSRNDDNNDQSTLDFSCSQDGRIAQKRRKVSVPVRNYEPYN